MIKEVLRSTNQYTLEDTNIIHDFDDFSLWAYAVVDDIWLKISWLFKRPDPNPKCSGFLADQVFGFSQLTEGPNILIVVGLLFSLVYFVGSWAKTGQTIGKSTLNIQVVGADGRPISWGRSLGRYVGYIINVVVASIGFLWIVFDPKRQGWHDKIAGTYVVSGDDEPFKDINSVEIIPSDHGKGNWIWVALWVVIALTVPAALFSGFLLLGPVVNRLMHNLLGG